jgi:hypothetical protein
MNWISKKEWASLKIVHLKDNKIEDEGALSLIEGEWPSLK